MLNFDEISHMDEKGECSFPTLKPMANFQFQAFPFNSLEGAAGAPRLVGLASFFLKRKKNMLKFDEISPEVCEC